MDQTRGSDQWKKAQRADRVKTPGQEIYSLIVVVAESHGASGGVNRVGRRPGCASRKTVDAWETSSDKASGEADGALMDRTQASVVLAESQSSSRETNNVWVRLVKGVQ